MVKELNVKKKRQLSERASEDFIKLVSFIEDSRAGVLLEYQRVQEQTGVLMDMRGKAKLRNAIIHCGREYALMPTVGYQLAEARLAMPIMTRKFLSIDSRIRRAEKAHEALLEFRESLTVEERRGFDYAGALFGAIRVAADNGKRLYGREVKRLAQSTPIVPD